MSKNKEAKIIQDPKTKTLAALEKKLSLLVDRVALTMHEIAATTNISENHTRLRVRNFADEEGSGPVIISIWAVGLQDAKAIRRSL